MRHGPAVRRFNGGTVLLFALILTALLALLAAVVNQTAILQLRMTGNDLFKQEAFYSAEGIATELALWPDNFPLTLHKGGINCAASEQILACDLNALSTPISLQAAAGAAVSYHITRIAPLLWRSFTVRESQESVSSNVRVAAANFEISVQIDASHLRRGKTTIVQGITLRVPQDGNTAMAYNSALLSSQDSALAMLPNFSSANALLQTVAAASSGSGITPAVAITGQVNYSGQPADVLIVAGDYDALSSGLSLEVQSKGRSAQPGASGHAIYIFNTRTGELIWRTFQGRQRQGSNTEFAAPHLGEHRFTPMAALDTAAGIIHRLYVGDSGGTLWRIDLPPNWEANANHRRDNWFVSRLADVQFNERKGSAGVADGRSFIYAPQIIRSYDAVGAFDGVLIQSGRLADAPADAFDNALFYIKDRYIESGDAAIRVASGMDSQAARLHYADLSDQTDCYLDSSVDSEAAESVVCAAQDLTNGWKMRFLQAQEKGLFTPLIDGGRVFASTFIPTFLGSCDAAAGCGKMYVLRLSNAAALTKAPRAYALLGHSRDAARVAGDTIVLPAAVDLYDDDEVAAVQILPSLARKIHKTHWRQPGLDPL